MSLMKRGNGEWSNQLRCSDCDSLRGRLQRLKTHSAELQAGYASLDNAAREELFANAAGLFNADLKTALTTCNTESVLDRLTSKM